MKIIPGNNYIIHHCGVILLAAGASLRLERSKQLLPYKGKSLIQHMVQTIKDAGFTSVIVVAGANSPLVINELDKEQIQIVINENWSEGIASSIRTGISALQKKFPVCDGAILMVVDQPHITPAVLNNLLETQRSSGRQMAASSYENSIGTPAIFHQSILPELLKLKGDKGAGKILLQRIEDVATVSFPKGNIDIDTEQDYIALLQDK